MEKNGTDELNYIQQIWICIVKSEKINCPKVWNLKKKKKEKKTNLFLEYSNSHSWAEMLVNKKAKFISLTH